MSTDEEYYDGEYYAIDEEEEVIYDDEYDDADYDDLEEAVDDMEPDFDDADNQVYTGDEGNEIVFCPDDTACFHGSTCILLEEAPPPLLNKMDLALHETTPDRNYGCNCPQGVSMAGGVDIYTGSFCEYEATTFCAMGHAAAYTFCANHGECNYAYPIDYNFENNESIQHHGCKCPKGFEGDKCQYENSSLSSTPFSPFFMLSAIVALGGGVVAGLMIRSRRKRARMREESVPVAVDDAEIQAEDGAFTIT